MITIQQGEEWIERVEGLFLSYGIKSVTMNDVAKELGISKKTLYQMVDSKDELVIKVLQHHISTEKAQCLHMAETTSNAIEEILLILDSNSKELSKMKTNIVHDLQKYHREAWALMHKFHYDFVFKIYQKNLLRGRSEGLYREGFDIEILTKLHLATVFTQFDPKLFPASGETRVTIFNEYMMHYLHGIVSPKGLEYLKQKLS